MRVASWPRESLQRVDHVARMIGFLALIAWLQSPVAWGTPPNWNATLGAGMLEDDHGTTHFVVVDRWKNVVRQCFIQQQDRVLRA